MASAFAWVKRELSAYPLINGIARKVWLLVKQVVGPSSAERHWDRRVEAVESGPSGGWLDSELVERDHIRPQVSGSSEVDYLSYFLRSHVPDRPVARALSLGCGGGNLERALISLDAVRVVEGVDASPGSIRVAQRMAAETGIADRLEYRRIDVGDLQLEEETYDFVLAKMSLHHFEALEQVFDQVAKALKPDAPFMFNEYVGPTRFQWTDRQLELMNALLAALPAGVRSRAPVKRYYRPTVAEMIQVDPSEAVRSADIMPLVRERFEIIEYKPYGGNLLHTVLSDVLPLLDTEDSEHRSLLRAFFAFERSLVEEGHLESDFAYVVARARE